MFACSILRADTFFHQLLLTGEKMSAGQMSLIQACKETNNVVRKIDHPDLTLAVYDGHKEENNTRKNMVLNQTCLQSLLLKSYLAIQSQKRCLFFVLLAFLSTLFYLCLYYSLMCAKTHRGGCQVCKCFWASEKGQRSTKCKILKISI